MEPTVLVRSTKAFGNSTPNETVSGQYFDNESSLNYNYYTDYNSILGIYIQSDPISLNDGLNTYGYLGENSLSNKDTMGLDCSFKDEILTFISLHPKGKKNFC